MATMMESSAPNLSPEQIAFFHSQGYLHVPATEHKLFSATDLHNWTDTVRSWPKVQGKWMPYDEITPSGERQIMRTENFVDYHDSFNSLLLGEPLLGMLEQLSGTKMDLFKDKINYKLATGNGFAAHTDAPAYDHMGKIDHLTANIAVDASNRDNGCLEVVPESHKMTDIDFVTGGHISDDWCAKHEWVSVPLAEGDILFFGSHLAHRSGPNRTGAPRSSVYATYYPLLEGAGLRQKYYADRRANFPPDHGKSPRPKVKLTRSPVEFCS